MQKAGLIVVMNVRGKGILERAPMGSTAERALRGSSCSLLRIPPTKPATKPRQTKSNRRAA